MSTIAILLKVGVHTRNWPRIDIQPLEFDFEFHFWEISGRGEGRGEGGVLLSFSKESNSRSLYEAQNLFKITKIIQNNYFD